MGIILANIRNDVQLYWIDPIHELGQMGPTLSTLSSEEAAMAALYAHYAGLTYISVANTIYSNMCPEKSI